MKSAKDLLDSLMGPSRNLSAKSRTGEDFMGPNVCKHFLVGFCPTTILGKKTLQKLPTGVEAVPPCTKMHSLALKEELEKHPQSEKYKKEYEEGFLRRLEEICSEADARGSREKRKCRPQEVVTKLPEHLKIKVQVYEEARRERLAEAQERGKSGDIEGSQMALRSAEQAQKDIDGINRAHTNEFPGESVCDACGVRYLLGGVGVKGYERLRDGDVWEDDHYASKAHQGYVEIREKLAELRKAKREEQGKRSPSRNHGGDRDRDRDRRGSSRADRSRSRGREGAKDGDREREGRARSRNRDRDREKERGGGDRRREEPRGADREAGKDDREAERRRNREKDKDRDRTSDRRRSRSR